MSKPASRLIYRTTYFRIVSMAVGLDEVVEPCLMSLFCQCLAQLFGAALHPNFRIKGERFFVTI